MSGSARNRRGASSSGKTALALAAGSVWGGGGGRMAFDRVANAALADSESVVQGLLPGGKRQGAAWVALNPRRDDDPPGSFKVNLKTGKWAYFTRGGVVRGSDLVSLAACVTGADHRTAAIRLAEALAIDPFEGGRL